jgi:hypothetical protein
LSHEGIKRLDRKMNAKDVILQTGDKFYDENGNLLWNTGMEKKSNVVRVIKRSKLDEYFAQYKSAKAKNMPRRILRWARRHSVEMNHTIKNNALFIYLS